ncbi:LacI family DNA-binding transcriptional regulator [Microbacterium betulae]|uniref:LacI family DNA-binding transcriptional regulator n=1 Tax=Microbacterium betulae TaxID=2981139 RepID=A0AA97FJQ9_9MICO|nr:LacI family DNA-binding transcriptional regulator [Microbacterium sp. AB]WOF22792.1 LacI family DNA-binding transcriptional regulator [Microbacterium sp. AB]
MSRSRERRVTSVDIARAIGVSQATVSNTINRPELVAEATRERVLTAMDRLGYVVNGSARTLRSGVSSTIGVLVLDVANPFWGDVIKGVESVASEAAFPLLIGSSNEDPDTESAALSSFDSQTVRGVLAAPTDPGLRPLRQMHARGTRVVLLDREDPEGVLPSVSVDHAHGAASAARHVIEAGHREIAFVNGSHRVAWCASRSAGVRDAAAGADDVRVHEIEMRGMSAEEGMRAVPRVRGLAPRVTAVLCANDMLALGVLKGLIAAGVRVPDDVSLVGYDDSIFASMISPALTTVRQDGQEIGRRAARLLLADDQGRETTRALQRPELVARGSVRRLSPRRNP